MVPPRPPGRGERQHPGGLAAVAYRIFLLGVSPPIVRWSLWPGLVGDERGVVAETAARRAARSTSVPSQRASKICSCAVGVDSLRGRRRRRRGGCRRRHRLRAAACRGSLVAGLVSGIAGGVDPRCAAEALGLDPRVVGERSLAGGGVGGARLDQRVGLEALAGLRWQLDRRATAAARPPAAVPSISAACGGCGWRGWSRRFAQAASAPAPPAGGAIPSSASAPQLIEGGPRERRPLGRHLDLDQAAVAGHHHVGVDFGAGSPRRSRGRRARGRRPCRR